MANFSIATINSSINLKAQASVNRKFNFYKWVKLAHSSRPDLTLKHFYMLICLASCTETQCYERIPLN